MGDNGVEGQAVFNKQQFHIVPLVVVHEGQGDVQNMRDDVLSVKDGAAEFSQPPFLTCSLFFVIVFFFY